jgi:hypothetical protein
MRVIGWKKLGQPDPESYFASDANNGVRQATQTYVPGFLVAIPLAAERGFRGRTTAHRVLLRAQAFAPLLVSLNGFVLGHACSSYR